MKKNIKEYQDAIEFIEYISISLEAGHHIQEAFFLATVHLSEGKFKASCVEVVKLYKLGTSFGQSLFLASNKDCSHIAKEVFENLYASLRFGTKVSKTISQISIQLRLQILSILESLAYEAPVKMIFPLVFFIFPVIFILLGTGAFISFIQSLGV